MTLLKLSVITGLFLEFFKVVSGFNINSWITRRNFVMTCVSSAICFKESIPVKASENENKPLTPEEMEEYKRLLKEAERIQMIIDINIKAANQTLNDDLLKLKK